MERTDLDLNAAAVAIILTELARSVGELSDRDMRAIVQGGARVRVSVGRTSPVRSTQRLSDSTHAALQHLGAMQSRDEALSFIDSLGLTVAELRQVARDAEVQTFRTDRSDEVKARIVDALVGSRLRSAAIRRTDVDLHSHSDVQQKARATPGENSSKRERAPRQSK